MNPAVTALPLEKSVSRFKELPLSAALKLRCKQRVAQCVSVYVSAGFSFSMPTISFDLRGRTAGKAFLQKNHVQFNAVLLGENAEKFIEQTVGHEVAHLATFARYGRKAAAHGVEWQNSMRVIGLQPDRCHSFDTANSTLAKADHRYVCACKEHWLTPRKHSTAQKRGLRCLRCSATLQHAPNGQEYRTAELRPPASRPSLRARSPRQPLVPAPIRRPPGYPRALPAPVQRTSTEAMRKYAQSLAGSRGLSLTPALLSSFDALSQFISQAKALPDRRARPPSAVPAPEAVAVEGPTEKQLAYAEFLARSKGQGVPPSARASRAAISAWITMAQALPSAGAKR